MNEEIFYKILKTNYTRRYRFPIFIFFLMFAIPICLTVLFAKYSLYFILLSSIFAMALFVALILYYLEDVKLKNFLKQLPFSKDKFKHVNNLIITSEFLVYWFRRNGYILKYTDIVNCSLSNVIESPWSSGFAYQVMLLIGFNNKNISVNMASRENAERVLMYIKYNTPSLAGDKVNSISLESIVEE